MGEAQLEADALNRMRPYGTGRPWAREDGRTKEGRAQRLAQDLGWVTWRNHRKFAFVVTPAGRLALEEKT